MGRDYKHTRKLEEVCNLWKDCTTCPFPAELNCNPTKIRLYLRRQKVQELRKSGLSIQEIANQLGVNRKTIWRDLK